MTSGPVSAFKFVWRAWLPTRGNAIFTVLVVGLFAFAQNVGAFHVFGPAVASTGLIPYQGRLTNVNGAVLSGSYNMTFKLYSVASGGSALWTETWVSGNAVVVSNGLFNVLLGSLTPISQNLIASNSALWLGITVGADSEMTPRIQLGSAPFAMQALSVPTGAITTTLLADGAITAAKIAMGAITTTTYAAQALNVAQANVTTNAQYIYGHQTEKTVAATGYVDLIALIVSPQKAATLRVNYHSMVWKTGSAGRTVIAIRIDGAPDTWLINDSEAEVGMPVSSSYPGESSYLSRVYFAPVASRTHTVTLVLGSWDNGTSHALAYGLSVETLQQP